MLKKLLPALAIGALATPALANEMSLHYGYVGSDSIRVYQAGITPRTVTIDDLDDFALTLNFDYQHNQLLGIYYSQQDTRMRGAPVGDNPGLGIQHFQILGTTLYPQGKWTHRVSAGLGGSYLSPDASRYSSNTRFSGQLAIGTRYALTPNLEVGIEARWLPIFMSNSSYIFCSNGCSVGFGSENIWNQFGAGMMLSLKF
ncbi:outer membrane beta-barrel protein [Umboniibacter marinipuniceus]|uniref:Outer membrane protein with beta-barrel domain n=1 Tax=Umboniibacter marinipuniceus TaxID=569599 RepID=A0A3M0A527_9GAMM|nr:outer membrane beta-barrel protein [Umboniibacter marinipuniceus]RMA80143.1 outer membrane protein with beta-barrel domain [Umboniibacter marinipuniceus]